MSNDAEPAGRTQRPPFHRRQYIVDRPLQFRLIGTLMAVWLANSVFFSIVLYFVFEGHLRTFYDLVPRPGMIPLLSLGSLFVLSIAFVSAFGFVILGTVSVYMSNQIAGPLFRMKRCLDLVGRGEWDFHLQFRNRDFLRDIPGLFNGMVDGLKQMVEADIDELGAIEAAAGNPAEIKRLLRGMRERKEQLLGLESGVRNGRGEEPEALSLAVH